MHLGICLGAAIFLICFGKAIYNIWFHPLKDFPGPLLARTTSLYVLLKLTKGSLPRDMRAWHDIYGDVVRIAPNQLTFIEPDAWKDIHRPSVAGEMAKAGVHYGIFDNDDILVFSACNEKALKMRSILAPSLTSRSLAAYEPAIHECVDVLVRQLHEKASAGNGTANLRDLLKNMMVDLSTKLVLSSDLACQQSHGYHPSARALMRISKALPYLQILLSCGLQRVVHALTRMAVVYRYPRSIFRLIDHRMGITTNEQDLIDGLLHSDYHIGYETITMNALVMTSAGSETMSSFLSGMVFLLLNAAPSLQKLTKELRSSFEDYNQITIASTGKLAYLSACIQEGLRLYPPAPIGLPRIVPKGGTNIAGYYVPEDSIVFVATLAANTSKRNFTHPQAFCPERFLGDVEFSSDRPDALNPFGVGLRNCPGKSIAFAEARLALAKVLFTFDFEKAAVRHDWMDQQKIYAFWDPPALNLKIMAA